MRCGLMVWCVRCGGVVCEVWCEVWCVKCGE